MKNINMAITPYKITECFRDFLKQRGYRILCTFYGFCPYFYVCNNEDVTYYEVL